MRVGEPSGLGGVADAVQKPEYATAVGLMMLAAEASEQAPVETGKKVKSGGAGGLLKKFFKKF